jgi:bifunctional polynucleotide phosphatase/kinase
MSILSLSRDFAANVGIPFHTPEEYFRHEDPRSFVRAFEPSDHLVERAEGSTSARKFETQHGRCYPTTQILTLAIASTFTKPDTPEIIMFCGSPGAGKSSFYWKHLQPLGYARVNQDILKTVSALLTHAPHVLCYLSIRWVTR